MLDRIRSFILIGTLSLILVSSCFPVNSTEQASIEQPVIVTATVSKSIEPVASIPEATHPPTPVPQPTLTTFIYGPDQADFPADVNPFTGLQVADPSLLEQPALLVSITHFPPQVRPQGGLSFAPWVFEYLIATGTTRFAAVFQGQFPYPEAPQTGDCEVRMEPFKQTGILLGNRVWLDKNADGVQSPEEQGVGGVCVYLYDADGKLVQRTSTDSNGYYSFNVEPGTYSLEFIKPDGMEFTEPNVGYEETDSDAEQVTGRVEAVQVGADVRLWDVGLISPAGTMLLVEPDPADIPPAEIGPVRSARLIHIHLQKSLQNSCLIYAGATDEIEQDIPACATVFKRGDGGMGAMLDISRMIAISEENFRREGGDFNYANNLFMEEPPAGGQPASQVLTFFSQLDQSKWVYDPSYQSWLRYVDNTSEKTEFHVDTDRLSGRQIHFENLIVLFVKHEVLAPQIIDMYLQQGEQENGFVFRDGKMYEIKWSTRAGEYEQQTGLRRPIAFLDRNGDPFPLRPGRSWIVIATPFSDYFQNEPGKWMFHIYAPQGAGIY